MEIPEWQVRMFYLGQESWFNLATANQASAAVKARDIYVSLVSVGWEETYAKFKPGAVPKTVVCSLGEFLADVTARSHLKPMTIRRYAVKLRKMVADLAKVDAGSSRRAKRAKFDHVHGGHKAWLAKVDRQGLDVLTPDSVIGWRNDYVAKAAANPIERKSVERSAASYLRCARALFSPAVTAVLQVKLPPNPFKGIKVKDPGPQRYNSEVDPKMLLASANLELRVKHPQVFLALFLCLWAGLRRKEADLLLWDQVDFVHGRIHIRSTEYFEPKTEESTRLIDLAPEAVAMLREFKEGSESEFVLNGGLPKPEATYDYYRANRIWEFLQEWLRSKGVKQLKAIHGLRKESGSLIASDYGIEAARQHLGHRDIRTTSAIYVNKKKRAEINLPLG